jgi:uncharacterized protein involved in exopolysaccharide biosynthesis/Mrp family chromosome partitioning ATPase
MLKIMTPEVLNLDAPGEARPLSSPPLGPFQAWLEILGFLRRRAWIVACAVAVAVLLGATYYQLASPSYESTTQLFLDVSQSRSSGGLQPRTILGDPSSDSPNVESQVEVLKSMGLASAVAKELQLGDDPEFSAPGLRAKILKRIGLASNEEEPKESQEQRTQRAAAALLQRLSVRRVGVSYVIEIIYAGRSPEGAARIASSVVSTYLDRALEAKNGSIQRSKEWLERRLAELEANSFLAEKALRDYKSDMGSADSPTSAANQAAQRGFNMMRLESAAASARSIYNSFLTRYMETLQNLNPIVDARVISPATLPIEKSSPKLSLVLAAAVFAGTVFGTVAAFIVDLMDRSFRSPRQVASTLNLPCLGPLPLVRKRKATMPVRRLGEATSSDQTIPLVMRQVVLDPQSPLAETLSITKTTLTQKNPSGSVVGTTSTLAKEGKTTVASNLAQLLAFAGHPTVLIDLDFRQAGLSKILAPHATKGLVDLCMGQTTREKITFVDELTGLHILPTVLPAHPLAYPGDLIESTSMKDLFRELRSAYKYVVVDLPSLVRTPEVMATDALLDTLILVIRWKTTSLGAVIDGLSSTGFQDKVSCVLLNQVKMRRRRSEATATRPLSSIVHLN